MKRYLAILFLLFFYLLIFGQNNNLLRIQNDTAEVVLTSVNIEVKVIGNIASTITEFKFYNPNNRVLEGELNFPLSDGQYIYRFAMDVNGQLREGVIVEKTLGRKAFEGVVRQEIDPGLLEQTVGNNYKARVYPIPAMGYKSILIGYEVELAGVQPSYQLIADYGIVNNFKLRVEVVNQSSPPVFKENNLIHLEFSKWRNSFVTEIQEANFDVTGAFRIELPLENQEQVFRQSTTNHDFFYLTLHPEIVNIPKHLPSSMAIIWDVSASSLDRQISKELDVLKGYLELNDDIEVRLITFSNDIDIDTSFRILNGNTRALIEFIKKRKFDGGTSFGCLDFKNFDQDEILFFTDGLYNLDKIAEPEGLNTVHVISSTKSINGDLARYITNRTGGSFINLIESGVEESVHLLSVVPYQFLGATYDDDLIEEVFPKGPQKLNKDYFSIAGMILPKRETVVILNFGYPGKIIDSQRIKISDKKEEISIERIWAKQKLAYLTEDPGHDQSAISNLGKQYHLVTPYTSLIVLDRIEDYVDYNIVPPEELKDEYNRLMALKTSEKAESAKNIRDDILDDYGDRIHWWKKNIIDPNIYRLKQNQNTSQHSETNSSENRKRNRNGEEGTDNQPSLVNNFSEPSLVDTILFDQVFEGRVVDESGEPLIGATIVVKDAAHGKVSDIDGSFEIQIQPESTLIISYTGYRTREVVVGNIGDGAIILYEDRAYLEEVVISGFARNQQTSGSVRVIEAENQLHGRAAGITIEDQAGSMAKMRGSSSLPYGSNPIYIVDGKVVPNASILDNSPGDIASVHIVKGSEATSLYGSMAENGMVVIITKNATEQDTAESARITANNGTDLTILPWVPDEPYLDSIRNSPPKDQYAIYLSLRNEYGKSPSFYLIVGNYFIQNNQEKNGIRVLSNIAELELENHELLKVLANQFLQEGELEISIFLLKRIAELRPDEPQSKRDLALAYQESGDYQKALDIFNQILMKDWNDDLDRFPLIKSTVLYEMNNLISMTKDLDLSNINKEFIFHMPVDIRIVLEWNILETDLDLWITEPGGEKCFYKNPLTNLGGSLTDDYVDGYGPEEYLIKYAVEGEYKIEVDYFDDRVQKVSGPVMLQVSIYTNYGSSNQKVKKITRTLKNEKETIEVGRFTWTSDSSKK